MSMFKKLATGCVVGSFTLLIASAGAQAGAAGQPGQAGTTAQSANEQRDDRDNADHKFLKKAAIANLAEIELGKLAQQKAQNAEVKQFAQMLVEGHTKALDDLKQSLGTKASAQLTAASAAFDRFEAINREILTLSHRNSEVRSLALSLGRKRMLTAVADDQLRALEGALAKHTFTGTR